ncbi:MAG: VWA domain-containing protein [Verrucomicrobiales bacterium]|nr:VWA domain-containing protein [Verrucomicrobiales bacterium]MCP5527896.1 VWA domain-containing protein [Verrucomicrobiales bacterium]
MTICLLADDSQSMAGQAAAEATEAIRDFVALLQSSCAGRGSCFRLLLIKFGDFPTVLSDSLPILDLDPQRIEIAGTSGGTDIAGALELAGRRFSTSASAAGALPPLVLLYSDGRPTGADPLPVSQEIKAMAYPAGQHPLLVTCGFGEADETLLRSLATSSDHYRRLSHPSEIRQFLTIVGTSVSTVTTEGRPTEAVWLGLGRALARAA